MSKKRSEKGSTEKMQVITCIVLSLGIYSNLSVEKRGALNSKDMAL